MTNQKKPECYPNLHAVPTKRLATNIVGSIIMAKGNINRWGALMERFLEDYRAEERALLKENKRLKQTEDLARRLRAALQGYHEEWMDQAHDNSGSAPLFCMHSAKSEREARVVLAEASKAGLLPKKEKK